MSFASRICSWSIVWVLLFTTCAPAFAAPQSTPLPVEEVRALSKVVSASDPPENVPEIIDFAKRLERSPFAVAIEFAALITNRGPTYQSLLDGRGRLVRSVTAQDVDEWQAELASLKAPSEKGRWLQLWIAEAEMGLYREPERARKMLTVLCDEFPEGTIEQGVAH